MAGADSEPRSQFFDAAFVNQSQGASHRGRRSVPSGGAPAFRTAAQARPKAGFESCRGGRKILDVVLFRRARRANGPAKDARGADGDENLAVEARIARKT